MLRNRVLAEDCNAGAIFDNLESEHIGSIKEAVELVSDALPEQNITLLMLKFGQDEEGLDVCDNFRYKLRKEAE